MISMSFQKQHNVLGIKYELGGAIVLLCISTRFEPLFVPTVKKASIWKWWEGWEQQESTFK